MTASPNHTTEVSPIYTWTIAAVYFISLTFFIIYNAITTPKGFRQKTIFVSDRSLPVYVYLMLLLEMSTHLLDPHHRILHDFFRWHGGDNIILQLVIVAYTFQQATDIISDEQNQPDEVDAVAQANIPTAYPTFIEFLTSGILITLICLCAMIFVVIVFFLPRSGFGRIVLIVAYILDFLTAIVQAISFIKHYRFIHQNGHFYSETHDRQIKIHFFLVGHFLLVCGASLFAVNLFTFVDRHILFVSFHLCVTISLWIFSFVVGIDRRIEPLLHVLWKQQRKAQAYNEFKKKKPKKKGRNECKICCGYVLSCQRDPSLDAEESESQHHHGRSISRSSQQRAASTSHDDDDIGMLSQDSMESNHNEHLAIAEMAISPRVREPNDKQATSEDTQHHVAYKQISSGSSDETKTDLMDATDMTRSVSAPSHVEMMKMQSNFQFEKKIKKKEVALVFPRPLVAHEDRSEVDSKQTELPTPTDSRIEEDDWVEYSSDQKEKEEKVNDDIDFTFKLVDVDEIAKLFRKHHSDYFHTTIAMVGKTELGKTSIIQWSLPLDESQGIYDQFAHMADNPHKIHNTEFYSRPQGYWCEGVPVVYSFWDTVGLDEFNEETVDKMIESDVTILLLDLADIRDTLSENPRMGHVISVMDKNKRGTVQMSATELRGIDDAEALFDEEIRREPSPSIFGGQRGGTSSIEYIDNLHRILESRGSEPIDVVVAVTSHSDIDELKEDFKFPSYRELLGLDSNRYQDVIPREIASVQHLCRKFKWTHFTPLTKLVRYLNMHHLLDVDDLERHQAAEFLVTRAVVGRLDNLVKNLERGETDQRRSCVGCCRTVERPRVEPFVLRQIDNSDSEPRSTLDLMHFQRVRKFQRYCWVVIKFIAIVAWFTILPFVCAVQTVLFWGHNTSWYRPFVSNDPRKKNEKWWMKQLWKEPLIWDAFYSVFTHYRPVVGELPMAEHPHPSIFDSFQEKLPDKIEWKYFYFQTTKQKIFRTFCAAGAFVVWICVINNARTTFNGIDIAQMETHGPLYLLSIYIGIMAAWFSGDTQIKPNPRQWLKESSLRHFPFSFYNHAKRKSVDNEEEQPLQSVTNHVKTTLEALVRKYRYSKITPKRDTVYFIQQWILLRFGSVMYALVPFFVRLSQKKRVLSSNPPVAVVGFLCNMVLAFLLQYFIQYAFFHDLTQYHRVLEDITDLIEPTPYDIYEANEVEEFDVHQDTKCCLLRCCRPTSQRVFRMCFLNFDDDTPYHDNLRAFIQIRSYIILIGMQIFQLNELFIVALWTTMLVCGGFLVVQMVVRGSITSPSHFGIIFGQILGVCWLTCFLYVGCRFDSIQSRQEGAFDKQKRLIEQRVSEEVLEDPTKYQKKRHLLDEIDTVKNVIQKSNLHPRFFGVSMSGVLFKGLIVASITFLVTRAMLFLVVG